MLKRRIVVETMPLPKPTPPKTKPVAPVRRPEQRVAPEVAQLSYSELRDEVNYLMRVRYLLYRGSQKLPEGSEKSRLRQLAADRDMHLQDCILASRKHHLAQAKARNPTHIDLHGYFRE
jgi:hypothetical protein